MQGSRSGAEQLPSQIEKRARLRMCVGSGDTPVQMCAAVAGGVSISPAAADSGFSL